MSSIVDEGTMALSTIIDPDACTPSYPAHRLLDTTVARHFKLTRWKSYPRHGRLLIVHQMSQPPTQLPVAEAPQSSHDPSLGLLLTTPSSWRRKGKIQRTMLKQAYVTTISRGQISIVELTPPFPVPDEWSPDPIHQETAFPRRKRPSAKCRGAREIKNENGRGQNSSPSLSLQSSRLLRTHWSCVPAGSRFHIQIWEACAMVELVPSLPHRAASFVLTAMLHTSQSYPYHPWIFDHIKFGLLNDLRGWLMTDLVVLFCAVAPRRSLTRPG
jgi:hypothetical protein